jgi:hypothetical protein
MALFGPQTFTSLRTSLTSVGTKLKNNPVTTKLTGVLKDIKDLTITIGLIAYATAAIKYGPIEGAVVMYSEITNNKAVRHSYFEEAKYLFARKIGKTTLSQQDMRDMFLEMRVVSVTNGVPSEEDLSWGALLDYTKRNMEYGKVPIERSPKPTVELRAAPALDDRILRMLENYDAKKTSH